MRSELSRKVQRAIEALWTFEPEDEPYFLCYSGGKDSDCIRILATLAGVKHEIHHNLTTVDTPETIRYIKSIPGVIIDKAHYKDGRHKTMWNLIPYKKMPPTRLMRYCCSDLKEQGGKGRLKITGVRASESKHRAENGGEIKIIGKEKTTQNFLEKENINFLLTNQGGWC
jgi:phosphoadenosine phosphosulfate reductase